MRWTRNTVWAGRRKRGRGLLDGFPVQRLSEFGVLSEEELVGLQEAVGPPESFARQAVIRHQGAAPDSILLLQEGWACSAVTLPSGERQLFKIHLPGDLMGVASICLAESVDSLYALTPVVIRTLPSPKFGAIFSSTPEFAARMYLAAQRERIVLLDRLSALGAKRASGRMAALLLDLHERLRQVGQVCDGQFTLRLTQDEIGDYLGLTAVHVNRTFRQLQESGLIERRLQRIKLLQMEALAEMSGYVSRPIDAGCVDLFRRRVAG